MRAYRALSREYDKFFQEIVKAGYTLVIISHATSKQLKEKGEKYDKTIPTVPDRGFQVIARLVDVCAYASYETNNDGVTTSTLTMRGNKHLEAGSRNKYMSEKIPFTYQALCDDMAQAVDKLESQDNAKIVAAPAQMYKDVTEKADYKTIMREIGKYANALKTADNDSEEQVHWDKYKSIVETYLGKGRLVSKCEESQTDMMVLILEELQDYAKENGITIQ